MSGRLILIAVALVASVSAAGADALFVIEPHAAVKSAPVVSSVLGVKPDPQGPDDSALRYYAAHGEGARAAAETERLHRLYPGWSPPKDLYSAHAAVEDESALWSLFAADKLDALRKAIAERERTEPGWRPSDDLRKKLRAKDLHERIMSLWKAGRWGDLVALVRSPNYDSSVVDVDALWSVAEGFARTKQAAQALQIYQSILKTDNDPHERLATYQKAMATLNMGDVEKLLASARKLPDGRPEYAPILIDIIRARMSAFLSGERSEAVPPDQVSAFEAYARTAPQPDQAALAAWYRYKLNEFHRALDWFKLAMTRGGDAMVAHGLANCLAALGYDQEAEDVAYAWRTLVNNEIFFLDRVGAQLTDPAPKYVEPARLAKFAELTVQTQAGEGAQALGWYAYDTCQFDIALEWFRRAAAWRPSETTIRGYALTLRRLGKRAAFFDLVNRYDGLFAGVEDLIFPDGVRHPPTICDRRHVALRGAQKIGDMTVPAPADPQMAQREAAPDRLVVALDKRTSTRMPKINRREFPAPTDPENPLARASDPNGRYLPEPWRGPWPIVARRTPGVGPMPYERYGFSLLPAWNGEQEPTWPPYSAQGAPRGTQAWIDAHPSPAKKLESQTPPSASQLPEPSPSIPVDAPSPAVVPRSKPPQPSQPQPFEIRRPPARSSERTGAPSQSVPEQAEADIVSVIPSPRPTPPTLPILARAEAPSSISFQPLVWRNVPKTPPSPARKRPHVWTAERALAAARTFQGGDP